MNYQISNVEQQQHHHNQSSTQQRQNPQKSQVGTPMNNVASWGAGMKHQNSGSPKNMNRKTPLYPAQQIQYQQINLPAVNQSRSERSLENSSGGTGILQQTQRFQGGSQTSRDHPSQHNLQNLQNQQMVPSVYTNQGAGSIMGSGAQASIKQNQNEKIKAYSRKLAKLVSSNNPGSSSKIGMGSQSNSKTPNSKKKLKTSTLGLTQNLGLAFSNNQDPVQKLMRSGLGTSRENIQPHNLNLQTQPLQYQYGMTSGAGGQVVQTARTNSNMHNKDAFPNQTFDIDEHIKNVIKSVERKNRKIGQQNNLQGYLQGGNSTGLINVPQSIAIAGGSQTARNNARSGSGGINEYSPTNVNASNNNKNLNYQQQMMYQNQVTANTATHKNTIFSNFSNQTYQMGQKKHSQQSHSLGKKGSHPGIIGGMISNSIMMTQAANNNRTSQRRRSSSKREGMPSKTSMSQRALQDSELYGGAQTQRTLQNYEDVMIKKFKDPSSSQSSIPSHSAYAQAKRQSVKGSKGINQSLNQRQNQSTHLNQSAHKKSGWFSPTSTYQGNNQNNMSSQSNAFIQQIALSGIDNNSSSTGIDKTVRTSQFVSPRSFQNKSGAYNQQLLQTALGNLQQQQRTSVGADYIRSPILIQSMDMEESDNANLQSLQNLKFIQNFSARKVFQHWKRQSGNSQYLRKREMLFDNMLTAKSQTFSENHRLIKAQLSIIKNLKFYADQSRPEKSLKAQDQEKREQLKVQQFNDSITNIKSLLEKMSVSLVKSNNEYERRIKESRSVGRKSSNGGLIENKQYLQKIENDNMKVIYQRCDNFDRFLKFILIVLCSTISEMLISNKNFKGGKIKQYVKFDQLGNAHSKSDQNQYMTNSYYFLSLIPDSSLLLESLKHGIDQCQQLIFNNRKLIECITKIISLFFQGNSNKQMKNDTWDINLFYNKIEFILNASQGNLKKEQVLDCITSDTLEAQSIVKNFENLKSILEFNEKWDGQQQATSSNEKRLLDINSNRETFQLMETYQKMIKEIPKNPIQLKCISLDFKQLYDQLQHIPTRVIKQIERMVATSLETDTNALKIDLSKAYEILQQNPSTLNIYVEQINTVKVIKETMGEFNNRHDSIKKLSLLCKSDNRIKINEQTLEIIKKVEYYIENLPILIRQSQEKLDMARPQMENQMKSSCISLTSKIKVFEQKYVEHYIEDKSKMSDSAQTLNEIKYRQKMMDDLRSKVDLYQECIQIMNMKDLMSNSEVSCFEDFKQMDKLHGYTLKLWTILDEWRNQKQSILLKPFLVLNFSDIATYVEDSIQFLEQKSNDDEMFKEKLVGLGNHIQKEMSDIQTVVYFLKDLKREHIKKRHWQIIFLEMGYSNFKEDFTIQDLQKMGIYSQNEKIREITMLAEKEYQFESQIVLINQQINAYKFKLTHFKEDIYLLSDFDIVQSQLEEFQIQLKRLNKDQINDVDTLEQLIDTQSSIDNMLILIEKWLDAQKVIITLDQIFSQPFISKTLGQDYKKFIDIKKIFKMQVSNRAQQATNINAFFQHQQDIQETLDKIISKTTLIQKSIEDFLETKRLAFPRFFFMTDKQFLEFIEMAEQNLDFNKFINILFPGAQKVFLDQPLIQSSSMSHKPKVPPAMVNDLSAIKSEFLDISMPNGMGLNYNTNEIRTHLGKQLANQKEMSFKQINTIELNNSDIMESSFSDAFNSNKSKPHQNNIQQQILNKKPKEVLGLISSLNELFLFEKKVPYMSNKVECWLQGTETNMQDTIGKLINYAVNTFPKQSLDEWILDYPQQIILTTIHLILTHEINELFEEMRKEKEGQGEGRHRTGDHNRNNQNSDNGGDSDDDYTGATPKTPDTRDLVKNSQISQKTISQQISQKSSVRYVKKQDNQFKSKGVFDVSGRPDTNGFNSKNIYNNNNQTSSNYSSNQQRINMIKNQLQFKNQFYSDGTDDMGYIANASDMGYPLGNLAGNECGEDDFSEAELEALDLSRERKKFASNMFGSDFELTQIADNKDDTMRILQEKSFRGLYLRLQFWINQICKSLYMSKTTTNDWKTAFDKDLNNIAAPESPNLQLTLHPVQKLVMQSIINFLSYMRDVVHELKYKNIDNVEDFEWQKQMRLTWNGKDSGCKVDCGAWTTQQANEYLGSQQRIPLTPLTNKYFVFISAAFREKSAVLFRSIPSHDYCGDIYQEFSNICSVPFKEYNCNAKLSMKSLMQFLNGAALASVWIFFEHVDKLDNTHLQTFNKEIQMVQQQFIIAELSQDSSVITAHITVGNQSISQCQRSIERIREQASQESKKIVGETDEGALRVNFGASSKIHIQGGADIKIEDNNDYDGDNDNLNGDKLNRQRKKQELQYKGLSNLSQVELEEVEDDDIHFEQDLLEEQDELKQEDENQNNNNTLGGGHSKVNNKVCFGVFASISHTFNLQNDKWATELSVALQSAFRVLSLTKPEMPIITSMILKSFGFRQYKDLAYKINDVFDAVSDMLSLNDKDDSFTVSVRDIKRLIVACNAYLEGLIIQESKEQRDQIKQHNHLMVYPMEKKNKTQILKEIEEEDLRDQIQKEKRNKIEAITISRVLELFLLEKLQVCSMQKKLKEDKIKKEVRDILQGVFGKEHFKDADNQTKENSNIENLIIKNAEQKGCSLNQNDMPKLKIIFECIKQANPVALVGKSNTGKSKLIKILAKQILQKELVFINPSSIGTHREMYGIYDPFSTNQHIIQQQLGQVKHSIFRILKSEISKPNALLVIDGGAQFDSSDQSLMIFNETLLPYLEKHKFKSNEDYNENNMLPYVQIKLPNGIVEQLKSGIPMIYELRTLSDLSPRFISALNIINMEGEVSLNQIANRMKRELFRFIDKVGNNKKDKQSNNQNLQQSVDFSVNQIVVPIIKELNKAKYLEKGPSPISISQAMLYCLNTIKCYLKSITSLASNFDQSLQEISLISVIQSVGYSLSFEGKSALEQICAQLKQQLHIRGNIFNYFYDTQCSKVVELKPVKIDNDFIINNELLRISSLARVLISGGKGLCIEGPSGTQKTTIMRYLLKNHQPEISSRVIKIPMTCYHQYKSLRTFLQQKQPQQQSQVRKPTLIVIDDLHIGQSFNIDVLEFLTNIKQNKFGVFSPESSSLINLNYNYSVLCANRSTNNQEQQDSKYKMNRVILNNDNGNQEYQDFFKTFVQKKLQVQPQYSLQLQNVLLKLHKWLKDNKNRVNSSQKIELSNLHLFSNMISKINSTPFKDYCQIESFIIEVKSTLTTRMIFPDARKVTLDFLLTTMKEELSTASLPYNISEIDNLFFTLSSPLKAQTNLQALKDAYGTHYSLPILQQLNTFNLSLQKKTTTNHFLFVTTPGSQIQEGINQVTELSKFRVYVPSSKKYTDGASFVDKINKNIEQCLRSSSKMIILIDDIEHNDIAYIDYIVNLIQAINDASQYQQSSSSYFNALSSITSRSSPTLRETLLQLSKESHPSIANPASPSSISVAPSSGQATSNMGGSGQSVSDAQMLINELNKISQLVTFVMTIQNLQNYHQYVSMYPQLENLFNVNFISSEKITEDKQLDQSPKSPNYIKGVLTDMSQWITEYSIGITYNQQYSQSLKLSQHAFNNQINEFYIGENKEQEIFRNGNFENLFFQKIPSELNIGIPAQYSQSKQRLAMFDVLYQQLKEVIYKSLSQQKSFYQKYYQHYQDLNQSFMVKLLGGKDLNQQITKQHVHAFSLLQVQERIESLQSQIKNKEVVSRNKEKEKHELQDLLEKLKQEILFSRQEADQKLQILLQKLKSVSSHEFKNLHQLMSQGQLNDQEMEIISVLGQLLYNKQKASLNYLSLPSQELLTKMQISITSMSVVQEQLLQKFYKNQNRKNINEGLERPLVIFFNKFIIEWARKQSIGRSQAQIQNKIKSIKEQISFNQSIMELYQKQVQDNKEELEDLIVKEKNMKQEMRETLKKVDMKELKQLRNEHKLKSLLKQGKKSEQKLDKIKIRMKNLDGDCLILACSILYLGPLSVQERNEYRKQLAEKLLSLKNIESSEYWQNVQSEQIHSKYFKKVIKNDLGLEHRLFTKQNHLFIDSLLSEFIFSLLFSPSTFVVYDSVGNFQQFLSEEVLEEIKTFRVKMLFSSDYFIEEKMTNAIEQQVNQIVFLNDVNDFSKQIQGKCQDSSILNKLSNHSKIHRIPNIFQENISLTVPSIILFSSNQLFNLNTGYLACSTIYNATFVNKNEAWIEIKQILLKHFLPDNYQKLVMIKQQIEILKEKLVFKQKAFDQLFIKVKCQTIEEKDHRQLEEIRTLYLDLKQVDEDFSQYNQAFHNLINEHPLLASYSNIFVILYYALKELTRFTEEITYSWKIYTKVIDMIIGKIIRDLTMNLKNKDNGEESEGEEQDQAKKKPKKDKEFTIDEEFFHSVIMPSIYSTIISGIKQDHVSLFNLLFSLEIALKKTTVTQDEKDFFVQRFFKIKNCGEWRLNPHKPTPIATGFADPNQRIKLNDFMNLKRDILKIYPELRKLFETIEIKIGKEFTYREANTLVYQKLFKQNGDGQTWKELPLIRKINVGFICPDDEWRSKICQFVYEELSTIFDFTEDLNKLHNFIKTASWSLPVALFTSNSINIVNTVCSIASYYGVGLEVLRTDYQQSIKKQEKYYSNKEINDNIKQIYGLPDPEKPLSNEAACTHFEEIDPFNEDRVLLEKSNVQKMFVKDELEIDDKQITQNQSSMQLIEKCAENGTWVLISTLKFPSFWYKISRKLEKLHKKGKVLNTFRLFFDLQGYSIQEIPESFLFNHCVKFYLTEKNNEDMEGFNDVWANILNDDLLNAKDLHNVPVLEPHSYLQQINLNLESNMYESSLDSMMPAQVNNNNTQSKEQMNPSHNKMHKLVKDDKITCSMSQYQSKDSILLPQIFTQEHMQEIMAGGNDLRSPKNKIFGKHHNKQQFMDDYLSEISKSNIDIKQGFLSQTQSLLMEDISRGEGAFLSELNHAFAKRMDSNKPESEQKYEMIKKAAPNHKRVQPPQKQ